MDMERISIAVLFASALLVIIGGWKTCFSQVNEKDNLSGEEKVIYKSRIKSVGHSILLPLHTGDFENEEYNLPIFILCWEDERHFALAKESKPRVHFALWKDGKIVWGTHGDKKEAIFSDPKPKIVKRVQFQAPQEHFEYFQSHISQENFEKFLANIDSIDAWEYTGRLFGSWDDVRCNLDFKYNGRELSLTTTDISWPNPPYEYPPREMWDTKGFDDISIIADKWQAIISEVEKLIPSKGERINLRFIQNPSTMQRIVLVQRLPTALVHRKFATLKMASLMTKSERSQTKRTRITDNNSPCHVSQTP